MKNRLREQWLEELSNYGDQNAKAIFDCWTLFSADVTCQDNEEFDDLWNEVYEEFRTRILAEEKLEEGKLEEGDVRLEIELYKDIIDWNSFTVDYRPIDGAEILPIVPVDSDVTIVVRVRREALMEAVAKTKGDSR